MRTGTWPDTAVRTVSARAFLNGVETDLDSVSLTAEMTPELPVVGGAAVAVTTGSVDWPQRSAVATTAPQPFVRAGSTWPPVTGTQIRVEVGDGAGQWWQQLTGRVDSTSGGLSAPQVQSKVIDLVDRLSVKMWHDPLLVSMPPISAGGAYRRVGLTGTYLTDLVARAAGFHATPPMTAQTRLSVPAMGSLWPEVGTSITGDRWDGPSSAPQWWPTSWGLAAWNVGAEWTLTAASSTPELTVCLATPPDGTAQTVALVDADGVGVFVSHVAIGDQVRVGIRTPAQTVLAFLNRDGVEKAAIRANVSGGVATITLRLPDGRTTTVTSSDAAFASGWSATRALMQGDGAIGAVLVEHAPPAWTSLAHTPTAIVQVSAIQFLDAMPALKGDTALSLLTAQAAAECASVWLDSQGRLRWVGRGLLELRAPVTTKTTDLTVDNLGWADNLERIREQITIKHRAAAISRHIYDSVVLFPGTEETLNAGQELESWIEPGADTDWVMPDLTLQRVTAATDGTEILTGSWAGAILVGEASDSDQLWATTAEFFYSVVNLSGTVKLTQSAGILPSGRVAVTKTPDEAATLPRWWHGIPLPLLRGRGKVEWSDQADAYDTGATAAVASYEHDCSWFVQNPIRLDELAAFLVDAMKEPTPEVTSVEIDLDPRLELGDKITITDPHRTGLELDLVITGISQSLGDSAPTMTLAGRLTRVERPTNPTDPVSAWDTLINGWQE